MKKKKIILFLMLISNWTIAQLYISSGTNFAATDAVNISIQETGFINDGVFTANNSTLIFKEINGSSPLEIGGTTTTSFHKLIVDLQNQNIVLENEIQVEGNVSFTNGIFDLNAYNLLLGNNGEILGESDGNCFIGNNGGKIVKSINLSNPTNANPGNLGAIISSAANLGPTTISRGHEVQTGASGGFSIERFYEIIPMNNSGLNATLRFHYFDGELNGIPENELELWRNAGSNWTKEGFTNRDTTNNYVELTGIDAFSIWTLTNNANALPVELINFTAKPQGDRRVHLAWETASELNNLGFEIQRSRKTSIGDDDWTIIGFVQGAGTSSEMNVYDFVDEQAFSGLNYYRLRQLDFDGNFEYSSIRVVSFGSAQDLEIGEAFPNPVTKIQERVQLPIINSKAGKFSIQLIDNLGRSIYQVEQQLEVGSHLIDLPLREARSGIYYVLVKTENEVFNRKIMVE